MGTPFNSLLTKAYHKYSAKEERSKMQELYWRTFLTLPRLSSMQDNRSEEETENENGELDAEST